MLKFVKFFCIFIFCFVLESRAEEPEVQIVRAIPDKIELEDGILTVYKTVETPKVKIFLNERIHKNPETTDGFKEFDFYLIKVRNEKTSNTKSSKNKFISIKTENIYKIRVYGMSGINFLELDQSKERL